MLSVGGNDIALRPTLRTAINMLLLTKSPAWMIKAGIAPGQRYFVNFLHSKIRKFLSKVVAKTQPAVVLVCMIYYPCEVPGGRCVSWLCYFSCTCLDLYFCVLSSPPRFQLGGWRAWSTGLRRQPCQAAAGHSLPLQGHPEEGHSYPWCTLCACGASTPLQRAGPQQPSRLRAARGAQCAGWPQDGRAVP